MKILLCHNYYQHPGGESQVFKNQVQGLRQMGEDVVVYTRENNEILKMSMIDKATLFFSAFASKQTRQEVQELLRLEKPDVAIVQNVFPLISPSLYHVLADSDVPIIQAVYNYRFICPSAELYTQGQICERCVSGNTTHAALYRCYRHSYFQSAWYASILGYHRMKKTFSDKITSFMVPDEFLGKKLVEGGIPNEKIWKNPNPFYVDDYSSTSQHAGYVLFVGRFVRQKGILTLIKAMKHTMPTTRLMVIGQGELSHQIQDELAVSDLQNRVTMLGPRWGTELLKLMRDSAAIVIPSEWYDNLPLIFCQANAMGKPVIASRIDGIPEYIKEGRNGFMFEVGDSTRLAELIDQVLSLSAIEYQDISKYSRAFAERKLDYSVHYRNLLVAIQKIRGN